MIQANATYKPGDRPESLIRYSGGLSAKVTVQLRFISRFLLSSVVYSQPLCAGGAEDTHAKTYLRLITTHEL